MTDECEWCGAPNAEEHRGQRLCQRCEWFAIFRDTPDRAELRKKFEAEVEAAVIHNPAYSTSTGAQKLIMKIFRGLARLLGKEVRNGDFGRN